MSTKFRLGLFVIAAVLMFMLGVFLIGSKQFLFRSTYRLNAEFQNVSGLTDGAEVRVAGLREGTVKHIDLPSRPDGKVKVAMDLKSDTHNVIKKDSVAAIKSEGLVGDKYVEISFRSSGAVGVRDSDVIQGEPPLDITDVVKKTDRVLDSAGAAVENLNSISSKINQGSGTLGALVNNRSMYNNVNAGVEAFQEDMEALKHNFLLRGFFKKRGYEDEADLTKDAIAHLPSGHAAKKFAYDTNQLFGKPDAAKLKKPDVLNDAGQYLENNPFGLAIVAVSSDMKGDSDKDRELTQARAAVVRKYLVEHFRFDDKKVRTIGLGKSPDVNGQGDVEVVVYPAGEKEPRPQKQKSYRAGVARVK